MGVHFFADFPAHLMANHCRGQQEGLLRRTPTFVRQLINTLLLLFFLVAPSFVHLSFFCLPPTLVRNIPTFVHSPTLTNQLPPRHGTTRQNIRRLLFTVPSFRTETKTRPCCNLTASNNSTCEGSLLVVEDRWRPEKGAIMCANRIPTFFVHFPC